jgi:hypothetical protein
MDDAELSFEFHGAQGMGDNALQVNAEVDLSASDRESVHLKIARADALKSVYPALKKGRVFEKAQKGRQSGSKNPKTQAMIKHVEMLLAALPAKAAAKDVRAADVQGLLSNVTPSTLDRYIAQARENVRIKT